MKTLTAAEEAALRVRAAQFLARCVRADRLQTSSTLARPTLWSVATLGLNLASGRVQGSNLNLTPASVAIRGEVGVGVRSKQDVGAQAEEVVGAHGEEVEGAQVEEAQGEEGMGAGEVGILRAAV